MGVSFMSSNFNKTSTHRGSWLQRIPANKSQIEDVTSTNKPQIGKADTVGFCCCLFACFLLLEVSL